MSSGPTHRTRRLVKERKELQKHFPGKVRWIDPASKTKVEVDMVSNNNRNYILRLHLPDDFPNSCPALAVVSPERIYRRNGEALPENSEEFHTLASHEGFPTICHYHPLDWHNGYWLHQVFVKGRIWIEAYEGHLDTGENLDYYLRRYLQSSDPSFSASSFSWSPQQVERLLQDKETLELYYPGQVEWSGNRTVDVQIETENDNSYTLRVYLPPDFPNACPTLAIVSPQILRHWENEQPLPENSEEFHTLGKKDDKITICHFSPGDWIGNIAICQVFTKGHI